MAYVAAYVALVCAAGAWVLISVALASADAPTLQALAPWLSYWTITGWLFLLVLVGVFFLLFRRLLVNRSQSSL
jgi:hypothetical protein